MKTHSCGALLYTLYNNRVYIILGKEYDDWFPFKGKCEKNETFEMTAVREIEEETCGIVKLSGIKLKCNYATSRKQYHIGLEYVSHTIITEFYKKRKTYKEKKYLEKTEIKMFPLSSIGERKFHPVTQTPINFYYMFLLDLQEKINKLKTRFPPSIGMETFNRTLYGKA